MTDALLSPLDDEAEVKDVGECKYCMCRKCKNKQCAEDSCASCSKAGENSIRTVCVTIEGTKDE